MAALDPPFIVFQFLKFGIVGAGGFFVDWMMLHVGLDVLHLGRISAAIFSFPFAATFTWLGNRWFTFREAKRENIGQQWLRFCMVCAVGLIFNRGTYSLLITYVALVYAYPILGLLGGTAAGMFLNFFVARKLVFSVRPVT